ncbi:MAG: molybdopterin molybdotransferase MoeA [Candidatus Omnitrophica bacterium]|nr:molybdopterin molybdotransferase MoeA [Candidatus Omnitrophota bacterium]
MTMISVDEAWAKIHAMAGPLPVERRRLEEAAGLVLADQVRAPMDLPPFDNSAMDGYALRAANANEARAENPVRLTVTGEVAAGGWQETPVAPGTAVKIMTGAALPPGADAVLMLEDGRLRNGCVEVRAPVPVGQHIRRRGEDVRHDEVLLEPGLRLSAQRLGLLANSGIAEVLVYRQAQVSLVATGSELVAPGAPLAPGQIYDSNRIVLRTLLQETGSRCEDLGVVPDEPSEIAERIRAGLSADLLLISGGVSVGAHDHVKHVLGAFGMETVFWRVAMKPGKPLLCGRLNDRWVFGLPGNPISCVVGFLVFIEPLIRRLEGERDAQPRYARALLKSVVSKKDGRRHFMTAQVAPSPDGRLEATPTEKQGSAMMQALAQANAFVVVPEGRQEIPAGEQVDVLRFRA